MFSVTTAATDTKLLSLTEMKALLTITDTSQDALLTELGEQISSVISNFCSVADDGVHIPTIRSETCVDTISIIDHRKVLRLSRRFVSSITSVVYTNGGETTTLTSSDYRLDHSAATMRRLSSAGLLIDWEIGTWTITYVAGFATVPPALKLAAKTVVQETWANLNRDLTISSQTWEGVGTTRWFDPGKVALGAVSAPVADLLGKYTSVPV